MAAALGKDAIMRSTTLYSCQHTSTPVENEDVRPDIVGRPSMSHVRRGQRASLPAPGVHNDNAVRLVILSLHAESQSRGFDISVLRASSHAWEYDDYRCVVRNPRSRDEVKSNQAPVFGLDDRTG